MITADTFFSGTINTVDAVIADFVHNVYMNFIQANSNVITLVLTVYVMFLGYQFLSHSHHFNLNVVTKHLIVMLGVYGLVMNWDLYNTFVYNIFTNEPGNVAKIVVDAAGKFKSGQAITQALDAIYAAVMNATINFFGQVNFSAAGVAFLVYGLLVFVIGTLLCVFALLLFVYAKMMMAVALALGPVFILFLLWNSTKGLFSAWLNKLITLALIPIVTSAILALMLSVIDVTLPGIHQSTENLQFYGIAPFLGLSLATTLVLSQVFRIAASLGGGITLTSLSAGAEIARSAVTKTGIASVTRTAANWTQRKTKQVSRNFNKGISP